MSFIKFWPRSLLIDCKKSCHRLYLHHKVLSY
ncbi:hypothetical protein Patl1_23482 [Pistacia atlantica]|uniref:Uncharacterized protein n=1 Tax=Pistacia atlantica TaxID=434234 RepID=A0ACC0ZX04_9ROSI|nr:hypothetical protein Patl1_23482 [Pistacia atlantica]